MLCTAKQQQASQLELTELTLYGPLKKDKTHDFIIASVSDDQLLSVTHD